MKKTSLVCFVSSMFYAANAQVEKGSIFTGGSVGFGKYKNDDLTSNLANSSAWNVATRYWYWPQYNSGHPIIIEWK